MDMSRISGLASGLDTESLVQKLMKAERIPLTKMEQTKQTFEWKQEDYRSMNAQLLALRDKIADLRLQGSFDTKTVSSTNSDAVTATAGSGAVGNSYEITVQQLAKGAFLTGDSLGADTPGDTAINNTGSTINIYLNENDTLDSPNGATIAVTAGMTVDQFVDAVNDQSDTTNVKVSFDEGLGRFFFSSTNIGSEAEIDFSNSNNTATTNAFLTNNLKLSSYTATGQDAVVDLNGTALTFDSNKFTISGVSYTIKAETTGPVNLSVSQDTDAIVDKIKGFVEKYNEVIAVIHGELNEDRNRDFPPLTDEQKKEMSDNEIELWMEQARSGMLQGDRILPNILYEMRTNLYGKVDGVSNTDYDQLAEIGISTFDGDYRDHGKLFIDETKLRAALEKDPEAVKELFTHTDSTSPDDVSKQGLAFRLYNTLNEGIDRVANKAGKEDAYDLVDNSVLGKKISDLDDRIDDFEVHLNGVEDRYWREFTAMEKAISQLNSQSSWLFQQFSG